MKYAGLLLLAVAATGCFNEKKPPFKGDMATVKQKLAEANEQLGIFFRQGNADSLAEMYTENGKLCPNGEDFVYGRENIRGYWKASLAEGDSILQMETENNTIDGYRDLVYETGKTYLKIKKRGKDSVYNSMVKFCNVWRLEPDGRYRLDVDIWNKLSQE
jgi:ketosteroid isomerase-like protein